MTRNGRSRRAKPVELDVEIWPTSIVVPPGYRIALSVRGKDYEYDGTDAALPHAPYPMKGVGPFTHTHPQDRPPAIFGGTNTLHFGPDMAPYVLLPVIPRGVIAHGSLRPRIRFAWSGCRRVHVLRSSISRSPTSMPDAQGRHDRQPARRQVVA